MDLQLNRLLEILDAEERLYHKMLGILDAEKEKTVMSDIKGLTSAYMEKQALTIEIDQLEKTRLEIMKKLSRENGNIDDNCTLTMLSKKVKEPFASGLLRRSNKLGALLGEVRMKNNANKNLFEYSVDLVQASLNLLGNLMNSSPVYLKNGATRDVASYKGQKLFCKSI